MVPMQKLLLQILIFTLAVFSNNRLRNVYIVFLITMQTFGLNAQVTDSIEIEQYLLKAIELGNGGYTDSSNYFVDKILSFEAIESRPHQYYKTKLTQIENSTTLRGFVEADSLSNALQSELELTTTRPNVYFAETNRLLGKILNAQGKLDEALVLYDSALQEYAQLSSKEALLRAANTHNDVGIIYARKSYFDIAEEYLKKALNAHIQNGGNLQRIGALRNNLGNLYRFTGKFKRSLQQYFLAVEVKKKMYNDPNHASLGLTYSNIAVLYVWMNEYHHALEYQKRALGISELAFGKDDHRLIPDFASLGQIYINLREDSLAEMCLNKARSLSLQIYNEDPSNFGLRQFNWGLFYASKKNYKKSIQYYERALKNFKLVFGENHQQTISLISNLGEIYFASGDQEKGKSLTNLAISLFIKSGRSKSDVIVRAYLQQAKQLLAEQNTTLALDAIENSINANCSKFDNGQLNYESVENSNQLLFALSLQGTTLRNEYYKTKDISNLEKALNSYRQCDTLLVSMQQGDNYEDRLAILDSINFIYDNAINIEYLLYDMNGGDQHLKNAFRYMERSKSALLRQRLSQLNQQKFGNIPSELLTAESNLQEDIAYIKSEIYTIENSDNGARDSLKLSLYKNRLFEKSRELDSLATKYKKEYEQYFYLKYDNSEISVDDLVSHIGTDVTILNYTLTKDNIYLIQISTDGYGFFQIKRNSSLNKLLKDYSEMLSNQHFDPNTFGEKSAELFQILLGQIDQLKENLVIIPDEELAAIPFETLSIHAEKKEYHDYRDIDYLIKSHNISYAHSTSSMLFENSKTNSKGAVSLLAMSSAFMNSGLSMSANTQRSSLAPLQWADKEIEGLTNIYSTSSHIQQNATEQQFRSMFGNKDIIHLASHGIVDHENPLFSLIVFETSPSDTLNDGYLYTHELYNMSLDADLVILSACNTATGQIAEGEGILSLGRGFFYAGVPSVVMSHWKVDDQSTSQLMQRFHQNLAKGYPKSKALRHAKLDYLQEASPNRNHPFYWGAFVMVGDDTPVVTESNWYAYLIGVVLIIMLVFLYGRRTTQK